MFSGTRLIPLQRSTLTSGLNAIIPLSVINPKVRLRAILVRAVVSLTQPGTGATAITGEQLVRWLAKAVIGKRIQATGAMLDKLTWLMLGRDFTAPADIPTTAASYTRQVDLLVPFADPTALDQLDTAPGAPMFKDETLNIDASDFASVFPAATSVSVALRPFAVTEPWDGTTLATPTQLGFIDVQQSTQLLPAGTYSHIIVYRESGAPITEAEVTSLNVKVDGETVMENVTVSDLAQLYNLQRASGGARAVASATAPEAGEALADNTSAAFLPIFAPAARYKLTKLLNAESQVALEFTGNVTGLRIAFRRLEEQGQAEVLKAAAKVGVPHLTAAASKTFSKTDPKNPRHGRLLPKRLGSAG